MTAPARHDRGAGRGLALPAALALAAVVSSGCGLHAEAQRAAVAGRAAVPTSPASLGPTASTPPPPAPSRAPAAQTAVPPQGETVSPPPPARPTAAGASTTARAPRAARTPARAASPRPSDATAAPAGRAALPTYGEQAALPGSLLRGAGLRLDARTGCVHLVLADGTLTAVLWPPGHTADLRAATVHLPDGRPLWRQGERRDVAGGFSSVHVDRIPAACRTGRDAWWAGDTSPARP